MAAVANVIGEAQFSLFKSRSRVKTVDETIPDYEFWDKLRRGKAKGFSLGGLFAKRIERVLASWVLGSGIEVTLAENEDDPLPEEDAAYTNAKLAEFVNGLLDAGQDEDEDETPDDDDRQNSFLMAIFKDALGLGDQYIIVNSDGTLSVPSPDTVIVKRHPLNYRRLVSVAVETKLDGYVITDEYRADGRTVTVKQGDRIIEVQQYQNLIGRIPVVHVAHEMSGNETYGHPIHEELRPLYDQYDDLIYKQIDGAKLMGNPVPAFTGMKDINAVRDANKPAEYDTYTDKDGNEVTRPQINLDQNSMVFVGEGGDFKFVSPPTGFTEDTKTALKSLFLLLLDFTGIPESIWGAELSSARATSDTQLVQFVKEIIGRQRDNGGWIVRLCKIWLAFKALTDPRIVVRKLKLKWPKLIEEDKEILLKFIDLGRKEGLLTDETALRLMNLVEHPEEEADEARKEADERMAKEFPDGTTGAFQGRLRSDQGDE
jgi:hypothetical protein